MRISEGVCSVVSVSDFNINRRSNKSVGLSVMWHLPNHGTNNLNPKYDQNVHLEPFSKRIFNI